jgi:predicted CoA-binding protein
VREAVSVRPKVIWLQEGIYHPEAVEVARANGIRIVWNRCMMMEHRRLFG